MSDVTFQRVLPAAKGPAIFAEEFVGGLEWRRLAPPGRPRIIVNFVTTADGNAAFDGRSAPLSDAADRALFHALRAGVDAIMAGTGTLKAERYRPAGKPVVTVTRSGSIPVDIPLFSEAEGRAIVFSGSDIDLGDVAAEVLVEPLTRLPAAMATLRARHGIDVLLCEGGPSMFSALVHAGLVDELFLTLSPNLVGGAAGPAVTNGPPLDELAPLTLASALTCNDTLFLRYLTTPA